MKKDCHYIYYSWDNLGRGYIGVRSCACAPELDTKYFGSFKDKTFQPTSKVIIKTFPTRSDAVRAEIQMHNLFNVGVEPHFANRAKQRSDKFDTSGVELSEEHRRKQSEAMRGEQHPNFGKQLTEETRQKMSKAHTGKIVSEETRQKMSKAHTGKIVSEKTRKKQSEVRRGERRTEETKLRISESLKGDKNPCFGTKCWVNIDGEIRRCAETPGPDWQHGRKWKSPGKTS